MNSSLLDKMWFVIKYMFSSYITLELFIFCLLLFILLILNLKRKNIFINIGFFAIFIGLFLGVFLSYGDYVSYSFRSLFKSIMRYIYFPSTIVYFFIILFVSVMIMVTVFSKKMTMFKKIFNYIFFVGIYFLFLLFVTLSASNGIELSDMKQLYTNNTILSLVQISNLLLLIWFIYTMFYKLYIYFKKKFD